MKKLLIFGTGYFNTEYKLRILKLWKKLIERHTNENFDVYYAIIDSNSLHLNASVILPDYKLIKIGQELETINLTERKTLIQFSNNIGHLCNKPGIRKPEEITGADGDGAGRAFCQGFKIAIENDFDYCIHFECDMLYFTDYFKIINYMIQNDVKYLSAIDPQIQVHENNVMFAKVKYLKSVNLIEQYNWKYCGLWPLSEQRMHEIVKNDVCYHCFNGGRDEGMMNNEETKRKISFKEFDYITHFDNELLNWIEENI